LHFSCVYLSLVKAENLYYTHLGPMKSHKPIIGITTDIKNGNFEIEEKYSHAIANAGGIPLLIPSMPQNTSLIKETVERIDGLLLPGSRDMDPKYYNQVPHPKLRPMSLERTEMEFSVLEHSVDRELPVFGICGGMQLMNVFFGGSLYQDIDSFILDALAHEKGALHDVSIDKDSKLFEIIEKDQVTVKSYHHQAVHEIGNGLKSCARSGDNIVEGIESTNKNYVLGIQWHPELEDGEISSRIFKSFIDECNSEK